MCFYSLPADFFDPGVSKFGEGEDSDDGRGEEVRGDGSVASQPTASGIYMQCTVLFLMTGWGRGGMGDG